MQNTIIDEETRYRLIKKIEANPEISQRELARELGISLGKANYCIKALIDAGWVKTKNFAKSQSKIGYAYLLTPKGLKEKADLTVRFLDEKQRQYELLVLEIDQLKKEVNKC